MGSCPDTDIDPKLFYATLSVLPTVNESKDGTDHFLPPHPPLTPIEKSRLKKNCLKNESILGDVIPNLFLRFRQIKL